MLDLGDFLNMDFAKIPETQFQQQHQHFRHKGKEVLPDLNGNVHYITSLCGVTIDCVSTLAEALDVPKQQKQEMRFYQIWQVNASSSKRILVSQKQQPNPNPLGKAALLYSQRKY